MRHAFQPRLINGVFNDPGLYIAFHHEKRAITFDLGDIHSLAAKDILKIESVYISHTHIDHFIGFDHLLRLVLGRDKDIRLYGPTGFLKHLEGKLSSYNWNLVEKYNARLVIHAAELSGDRIYHKTFKCQDGFSASHKVRQSSFDGVINRQPAYLVRGMPMDHGIPCMAYSLEAHYHINIRKDVLNELNLASGPWITEFKKAVYEKKSPDALFYPTPRTDTAAAKSFRLGELMDRIALITPGSKICYITDICGHEENIEKAIQFAADADYLFIESPFLYKDLEIARRKQHLTARQAGEIARRAGVKQLTTFHFSPRYTDSGHLLEAEAQQEFHASLA